MLRSCTPGVARRACCRPALREGEGPVGPSQQTRSVPAPGFPQPDPLILRPGPIYAVDGDRGIDQRIVYSLLTGE